MTEALNIQVGGNHYKEFKIQPAVYSETNNLSWAEGEVVKYITRWRNKGGIEDLRKAKHCIDILIQLETQEKEQVNVTSHW